MEQRNVKSFSSVNALHEQHSTSIETSTNTDKIDAPLNSALNLCRPSVIQFALRSSSSNVDRSDELISSNSGEYFSRHEQPQSSIEPVYEPVYEPVFQM